ncbi:transcription factor SCREAM2 [Physcomitrium patens]|uniref:BHLH domain-containing protein n=1 Tax=Physcomitrium patens TaxID=3218 RepID=A0A2K1KKG6_PHYPA|nr:uncharacterized protein LOC112282268 [Physcomitrium patens]XP_024375463.1 uncharacterized protein LOC112282268 [Physcomitrium patens]XP_024375464.1 uncharacterized protein LOC112282268 [Physcomitrium patens]PNR54284.1 hypothetical protein PHYPA_007961 [Physcomitrium patens]|eukprot:XP_024375462.1 uncharacterized protein LOC112282268 [Physcomitrella patens]
MAFGIGSPYNIGGDFEAYTQGIVNDEYASDVSSDSEDEEVFKTLESNVPRSGKRTYGVPAEKIFPEHRRKNAKLDQQLAILRSMLPSGREVKTFEDERVSIVMNAYKHVLKLQKCVGDLNADLASLQNASASPVDGGLHPKDPAGTQTINMSSMNDVSYEHPEVEVKRVDGKMELHITCLNRAGLLLDILTTLDSKSISVPQGSIICCENILFLAFRLEVSNTVDSVVLHAGSERLPEEADDDDLKHCIVRSIRQGPSDYNSK